MGLDIEQQLNQFRLRQDFMIFNDPEQTEEAGLLRMDVLNGETITEITDLGSVDVLIYAAKVNLNQNYSQIGNLTSRILNELDTDKRTGLEIELEAETSAFYESIEEMSEGYSSAGDPNLIADIVKSAYFIDINTAAHPEKLNRRTAEQVWDDLKNKRAVVVTAFHGGYPVGSITSRYNSLPTYSFIKMGDDVYCNTVFRHIQELNKELASQNNSKSSHYYLASLMSNYVGHGYRGSESKFYSKNSPDGTTIAAMLNHVLQQKLSLTSRMLNGATISQSCVVKNNRGGENRVVKNMLRYQRLLPIELTSTGAQVFEHVREEYDELDRIRELFSGDPKSANLAMALACFLQARAEDAGRVNLDFLKHILTDKELNNSESNSESNSVWMCNDVNLIEGLINLARDMYAEEAGEMTVADIVKYELLQYFRIFHQADF